MDSIIFDVDGTLWDSTEICAKAWTDVIHRETSLSLTINASTLKGLFGRLASRYCERAFCGLSKRRTASSYRSVLSGRT